MLTNPRLVANRQKLFGNARAIVSECRSRGIAVAGVTKSFAADPALAEAMVEAGISQLADSRLENLVALTHLPLPKLLLRLPMQSEIPEVVRYADISLNSELDSITRLSQAAVAQGRRHQVILMVDLGDRREGVLPEELDQLVRSAQGLPGVELLGIGSNLTCLSGVLPTEAKMRQLLQLTVDLRRRYSLALPLVSAGNSSCLHLVYQGLMPAGINHLRIGKAITLGREAAFGCRLPGTHDDVFTFQGEVVELRRKPSLPDGEIVPNTFGERPEFLDQGERRRAVVACGRQDIDPGSLFPLDPGAAVVGASSDHLVVDVTESREPYAIGDGICFRVGYSSLLAAATSKYVKKLTV